MQTTSFGRSVYALGNNPRAAKLAGLPVVGLTVGVYMLGGLFSGIAGFLNAAYVPLVSQTDGMNLQFQVIIAALVGGLSVSSGGVGRVEKTLLGVLIIEMIMNYEVLKNIDSAFQQALLGGLLVVSIVVDRLVRGRP
jgi:ribose/xylose/arabinose/galactoside ABC-type transport system permease subunit